jgi:hypothetical protein
MGELMKYARKTRLTAAARFCYHSTQIFLRIRSEKLLTCCNPLGRKLKETANQLKTY